MRLALVVSVIVTAGRFSHGHEVDRGTAADQGLASRVVIREEGNERIIEANGLPNHEPGRFPNRGNPNAISEQRYRFTMPLTPRANEEPTPVARFLFGVAINGVVFDPGTAEAWLPGQRIQDRPGPGTRWCGQDRRRAWNYEGMGTMQFGIDDHHAHVQPNGAYHYHGLPTGVIVSLRKEHGNDRMLLIGYAADGFPIYAEQGHENANDSSSPLKKLRSSYRLKKGARPLADEGPGGRYDGTFIQDYEFVEDSGDLDECNGRNGITPEYPDGTYYYVAIDAFPFIPRFFRGTPDNSFAKRGPGPPPSRGGNRRPPPRRRD